MTRNSSAFPAEKMSLNTASSSVNTEKITIWDIPTRIFHWLLFFSVTGAWVTSFQEWWLIQHIWFGHMVMALVIFRIIWGFVGGQYSLFRQFVVSPRTLYDFFDDFFKNKRSRKAGHNPPSAWMILALLTGSMALSLSGIVTLAGEERAGPLVGIFSPSAGEGARNFHEILSFLMLSLVSLHVFAAILESIHLRENLPWSMITGKRNSSPGFADELNGKTTESKIQRFVISSVLLLILTISLVYSIDYHSPLTLKAMRGEKTPEHVVYLEECGVCHFGFHPSLLSKKSWILIMNGLENHFGEDAMLDEKTDEMLRVFLVKHSAEQFASEASYKIMRSLDINQIPLRITEIPYWIRKHESIAENIYHRTSVKGPLNCDACHRYAEYGSFEDQHIRIPDETNEQT